MKKPIGRIYPLKQYSKFKSVVILFLLCLSSFYIGKGLFTVFSSSFSIGNIIRAFSPAGVCIILLLISTILDLQVKDILSGWKKIKTVHLVWAVGFALLIGISPIPYLGNLPHFFIALTTLVMVSVTLILAISRDDSWPFSIFLLTEPFLSITEIDLNILPLLPDPLNWSNVFLLSFVFIVSLKKVYSKSGVIDSSLDKYILAFTVILFFSSFFSSNISKSFSIFFEIALVMPMLFFLTTNYVQNKKDLITIIGVLVARSVLKCFLIYYFSLRQVDFQIVYGFFTGVGYLVTRLIGILAANIVIAIPIAISLGIIYSKGTKKWMLPMLALLFLVALAIYIKIRSLQLAILFTFPLVFLYKERKKIVLSVTIVLVIIFIWSGITQTIFHRLAGYSSLLELVRSSPMRLDAWRGSVMMIKDYPFFGIGLGNWNEFAHLYFKAFYFGITGPDSPIYISSSHNIFLHYGVEEGLGAFLLLVFFAYIPLKKALFIIRETKDVDLNTATVGLGWAVLALIILSSTGGEQFSIGGFLDMAIAFWVSIGLIMSLERIVNMEHTEMG